MAVSFFIPFHGPRDVTWTPSEHTGFTGSYPLFKGFSNRTETTSLLFCSSVKYRSSFYPESSVGRSPTVSLVTIIYRSLCRGRTQRGEVPNPTTPEECHHFTLSLLPFSFSFSRHGVGKGWKRWIEESTQFLRERCQVTPMSYFRDSLII